MRASSKGLLIACGAVGALAAAPVFAQTAPPKPGGEQAGADAVGVGDIIVTAQKRSERLSDVPLSIAAATGPQLAKAGVVTAADLGKIVTGFTYQPSNYGPPVFSLRGIGFFDNTLATSPTVSVYVDQIPLPYLAMVGGATLDLERVEVLKGPQGTLFGQNATGGAINFIAAKPTTALSAGGSVEYARFGQFNAEGYVSGSLSDTLGVRLSGRTEQGGAWQRSTTRPNDKVGDRDFTTGRLLLDWDPSSAVHLELSVNGWIDKSETQAAQYQAYAPTVPPPIGGTAQAAPIQAEPVPGENARLANWDAGANLRRDSSFYQFALTGQFDLSDSVTMNTITAYSHLKEFSPYDADGTSFQNMYDTVIGKIETFNQEVRFSGKLVNDRLSWMLGGNYAYSNSIDHSFLDFIASNAGVGPFRYTHVVNISDVVSNSYAVFGGLDYRLTETLLAQVSARYTDQNQKGSGCMADGGNGTVATAFSVLSTTPLSAGECVTFANTDPNDFPPFTPLGGLVHKTLSENNASWRVNLSWKPNSDVHLYANVTKGYKSGSFPRLPDVFQSIYTPVAQESVLAYEAGFKVSALDRTLDLSGAVFYYDYKDKQILGYLQVPLFGNLPALVTVPKSHVTGGELNVNWRPISGLTINGGVTYVDAKVDHDPANAALYDTRDPNGQNINIQGYRFPITARWQASGGIDYGFPVSEGLTADLGANLTYRSSTPATFGGGSQYVLPAYTLVDLRAGIGSENGRWHLQAWGRNIFNKFYLTNAAHVVDTVTRTTGRPATYGATLSFKY